MTAHESARLSAAARQVAHCRRKYMPNQSRGFRGLLRSEAGEGL